MEESDGALSKVHDKGLISDGAHHGDDPLPLWSHVRCPEMNRVFQAD